MAHLLGAESLHLEYPTRIVFDSVTLGVDTGDMIGIVGRNGDGKSSLLGMLAGTITIVYRADRGRVSHQLAETQADYLKEVISAQHVFLEEDQSLEVLLVQGPAIRLKELCDALRRVRGVQQLQLVTTTALLPPLHEQDGNKGQPAKATA